MANKYYCCSCKKETSSALVMLDYHNPVPFCKVCALEENYNPGSCQFIEDYNSNKDNRKVLLAKYPVLIDIIKELDCLGGYSDVTDVCMHTGVSEERVGDILTESRIGIIKMIGKHKMIEITQAGTNLKIYIDKHNL